MGWNSQATPYRGQGSNVRFSCVDGSAAAHRPQDLRTPYAFGSVVGTPGPQTLQMHLGLPAMATIAAFAGGYWLCPASARPRLPRIVDPAWADSSGFADVPISVGAGGPAGRLNRRPPS